MPEDEQFDLVFKHAYIAEANDTYARSVGYEHGEDLVGKRIEEFASRSEPTNIAAIKALIRGGFNITGVESVETYKEGITRIFLNNACSVESQRVILFCFVNIDAWIPFSLI